MMTELDAGTLRNPRRTSARSTNALDEDQHPSRAVAGVDLGRLSRGLGWFSLGLGLAELFAPRVVARAIGLGTPTKLHTILFPVLGLREIASGLAILTRPRPARYLWSRVAGDVVDLALLATALGTARDRVKTLGATAAVLGVTALDAVAARRVSGLPTPGARSRLDGGRVFVEQRIVVNCPPEQVYALFRHLEGWPRFMKHLESVRVLGPRAARVAMNAPFGKSHISEIELVADRPEELIAWRSVPGASIPSSGEVRFSRPTGGRGTLVRFAFDYRPLGGLAGELFARLFQRAPEQNVVEDLRRMKQLLEAKELPTTEGQSSGRVRSSKRARRQRRATPAHVGGL